VFGNDLAGLEAVRSLGRQGIRVSVVGPRLDSLAAVSRYCTGCIGVDPDDDDQQLRALSDLAVREGLGGSVLIPTGDETAALVATHHASLSRSYRLTTPPWPVLAWLYDKRRTYQLARRVGVGCPVTVGASEASEFQQRGGRFPAVVKPAVKREWSRRVRARAWRAEDPAALAALVDRACRVVEPEQVLVQELVPGDGSTQYSYGVLCDRGRVVAAVAARRLRQYPIGFGRSSSFVETVDEPDLAELGARIVAAIGYTGLLELEFKRDGRDRQLKLLDANPRVWTWYALARRAGVDLTYLAWRLASGERVERVEARTGVRWMRAGTDVLAVAQELAGGRTSARAYLRGLRGPIQLAIAARDDPLPLLAAPLVTIRRTGTRAAGTIVRATGAPRSRARPGSVGAAGEQGRGQPR
jgi:predicted ATP-grasp superfamily ATP-dependent carboligase